MEVERKEPSPDENVRLFVSVEGKSEILLIEVADAESTVGLRMLISQKYGRPELQDLMVTVEDQEAPAADTDTVSRLFRDAKRGRLHLHRCKEITVTVEYNAKTHSKSFAPAATVHRVFIWAISKAAFNLETDAHDLELQLPGATNALPLNTHIGTIAARCELRLQLVPKDRPQG